MQANRISWILGSFFALVILLYFLNPILTPFYVATLLAYLGNPLVRKMTAFSIPRGLGAFIVFLIIFALLIVMLLLLIPLIEHQLVLLIGHIPSIFQWVQNKVIPWLTDHFAIGQYLNLQSLQNILLKNWQQAGTIATSLIQTISHSGYSIFNFILNLVLVPIVTFYLLRDWPKVIQACQSIIPLKWQGVSSRLFTECDEVISAFFRGQLMVMLGLAAYYSFGLSIIGLQYALLIGVIIGLISIVPYLGAAVGIFITSIAVYVQFDTWQPYMYAAVVFVIGHILEGYILTPKLVGDRIGLHPVAVIFAILAGGQIFGFVGVLLALPVAAVLVVVLRYIKEHYLSSSAYLS